MIPIDEDRFDQEDDWDRAGEVPDSLPPYYEGESE